MLILSQYVIREEIATGSSGHVYRAVSPDSTIVAVKVVPLNRRAPDAERRRKMLTREIRIHETLQHTHILRLLGGESHDDDFSAAGVAWPAGLYIVLELALGGDLFDKIAPDIGVDEEIAHLYFTQLVLGLRFLGHRGICHRDIKPENCLLDGNGNLKIADFGLATVFKYKGETRLLRDRCGSLPYAAPELADDAPYAAEPVDVWSAGVVLFALLAGNTPWDQPTPAAPEFAAYLDGSLLSTPPWSSLSRGAREVLRRMLAVSPAERIQLVDLDNLAWFRQPNALMRADGQAADGALVYARMSETLRRAGHLGAPEAAFEEMTGALEGVLESSQSGAGGMGDASQALGAASQAILSQHGLNPNATFQSSLHLYSRLSMAPSQKTNANITRFFTTYDLERIVSNLLLILDNLGVKYVAPTVLDPKITRIKINTKDRRREPLLGAIHISRSTLPEDDGTDTAGFDVVMWKKKADPLELKRLWAAIVKSLPTQMIFAR